MARTGWVLGQDPDAAPPFYPVSGVCSRGGPQASQSLRTLDAAPPAHVDPVRQDTATVTHCTFCKLRLISVGDVMERLATTARPLRVAIIGAGPAGVYAAEALLKVTVQDPVAAPRPG